MDFELHYTEEQEKFREEVRAFFDEHAQGITSSPDPDDFTFELYQKVRKLGKKMGERGWNYPLWPKEYGGGGLPMDLAIIIHQEAQAREIGVPPFFSLGADTGGPCIMLHGTEEQKRFFLSHITAGDWIIPQAMTEPEAGSDAAGAKVTAIRDGDDFIVNGQKHFIGDGVSYDRDYLWTTVCTDPQRPKHENLGVMMIPANLPGITIRPMDIMHRVGYSRSNEIWFDNVRVSAFHLIGKENEGWQVLRSILEVEHGAARIGGFRRDPIIDKFLDYCKETKVDGQPLSKDPDARDRMADIYIDAEINRLFNLQNSWIYYANRRRSYEGSLVSIFNKTSGLRIAKNMQECLGYFALTQDPQWVAAERWIDAYSRHAVINVHPGGTLDIHKGIAARRLGVGRGERQVAAATV